jgi:hypothetical protein
MLKLFL